MKHGETGRVRPDNRWDSVAPHAVASTLASRGMRPARSLFVALVAAVLLAGCGDDERDGTVESSGTDTAGTDTGGSTETTGTTTEGAAPSGPVAATVRVVETDFELTPANPNVSETGVVEFKITNRGQVTHALEVEGPEGERETDPIAPGKSATLKVDLGERGRYEWYCPIGNHRERGMRGEVVVAGGGTDEPEDDGGSKTDAGAGSDGHGGY